MQTFLPYRDPKSSAKVLDNKRLGKQRVETVQILNTLLNPTGKAGWKNHPAVLMWAGYESYLVKIYLTSMIGEWKYRGYRNIKILEHYDRLINIVGDTYPIKPPWINQAFCDSHKSNLIRKKPDYYGPIWPDIPDNLDYIWPVKK